MCDRSASVIPASADGGLYWDYGKDDYWDPAADPDSGSTAKLPSWAVNLSKFLCPSRGATSRTTRSTDLAPSRTSAGGT